MPNRFHPPTVFANHLYDQATFSLIELILNRNLASLDSTVSFANVKKPGFENRKQSLQTASIHRSLGKTGCQNIPCYILGR